MMRPFRRSRKDYPQGVIGIYDNGGRTADRYTVAYEPYEVDGETWFPYTYMSAAPFWPQGVCMHGEGRFRPDSGWGTSDKQKTIAFEALPADCQRTVHQDLAAV